MSLSATVGFTHTSAMARRCMSQSPTWMTAVLLRYTDGHPVSSVVNDLVAAGMPFDVAYAMATGVQQAYSSIERSVGSDRMPALARAQYVKQGEQFDGVLKQMSRTELTAQPSTRPLKLLLLLVHNYAQFFFVPSIGLGLVLGSIWLNWMGLIGSLVGAILGLVFFIIVGKLVALALIGWQVTEDLNAAVRAQQANRDREP